ncbi:hypothetical protein C8A03DRAFT_38729 [Achaetomium macrosporum]|uniref:Uncharacterized protein n=1 Tax=Achaetomium macrosporum TaxID=79813 RepID=A0AAN7H737_9PEZI|nr:hypothetical protein C8A03DRAFT_38729 [Achaetomium macrosporum]
MPVYQLPIKIARMLVAHQAITEQREEIEALAKTMDMEEARAAATGLFRIVRGKVQRFMTWVTDRTEPTPMDWIFEARTYGMRIRFTTAAAPVIDWIGERIAY